jgi:hypothetical protein
MTSKMKTSENIDTSLPILPGTFSWPKMFLHFLVALPYGKKRITSWAGQSHTRDFLCLYHSSKIQLVVAEIFQIFLGRFPLEVVFIYNNFQIWFGPQGLSLKVEDDQIIGS